MLNSLRDGQINYGTSNCPSAHVPPHNVVTPLHQNSLMSTETTTPVVYPWNSNPRLEHLYGFHSRYYNLDFPAPYSPASNQYVPTNVYGQNVPQCCQPCCRLRSQNIPKTSPQVLYNPIRPVQQVNRSYKSKKTLKTPCSEQFLPYITNDVPVQYDTQNGYQQKYSSSYLNSTNYCSPSNNNLWVPPAANSTWSSDRLRPLNHHTGITPDFSRDKNHQRLPNYQNNSYSSSTAGNTHHRPYNYNPPIPEVHDYRPAVYHNQLGTSTSEYIPSEHSSRLPSLSQNNQSQSSVQQYFNIQPVPYSEVQRPSEQFRTQVTPQSSSKSNLNVREFLANWDEGEEESSEKSSETTAPIVVLDCMTLEGEALTKIQEKLNVVSYENLEKVLKDNQSPLVINTESNQIDSIHNKTKPPVKPNFEPLDYTKRETGIIKPFVTEKKSLPEVNSRSDKSYSVNFDGMVTWYGKKTTDISSTDLIEKLADRIFNLSKSQENEGVSFGTAAYTGQITQTNRSVESLMKDPAKYVQSPHMFNLQNHPEKCIEPSIINKIDGKNDSVSRTHCCVSNESNNKASIVKSNNTNTSCIVENVSKKCLNVRNSNEETTLWNLNQGSQEQHLNMSLYDHNVVTKPLDFSSLTDENKGNPFAFEKHLPSNDKPICNINNQYNKVLNENNNYSSTVSNNQHSIQQIDSSNRNFPVIVSPHIQRHEYNVFHESVIQRTGCDKNKHEKVSTQADFESMNWNLSNDLDKIIKNTNIAAIEPPCLYDRNNFSILDSMNSNKIVPTPWKDTVPCVDLTVNSKTNPNNDSFFDGWNFIDSYEHLSSKKVTNSTSNSSSEVHNPLFFNQVSSLEDLSNRNNNNINKKVENEVMKDVSYAKSSDLTYNSIRSRDVFNLNSRIPDFSDGFELTTSNELHEYMQFKKSSNDIEHRTDGSIFEHLTEPKCVKNVKELAKNEQIKSDIVGLPIFKEKDPLAPMSVPSKLNVVKPIIRDPNQIFTVIKQKSKHDNANACVDNDSVLSNKAGLYLRGNQTNIFNGTDLKPKYNNGQLSQFDVWSEKFVLNGNTNNSSSSVVQCDVEITQFKSTSENCNTLTSKSKINENYLNKNTLRLENVCADKLNINENDKINSNDFLQCLDCSKTDSQKYRDPLDEFETSFGFDMHCNNESNKSFHENIVDKCLEERIKDQIGEHNMNTSSSTHTMTSNNINTQLPFQCDFQSSYLIKNYFDENKNKPIILEQDRTSNNEKLNTTSFNFNNAIEHSFELQNDKNIDSIQNSRKKSDFTIMNEINHNFEEQIKNNMKDEHSNCLTQTNLKLPFASNHENINTSKIIPEGKNNFNYLTIEDRSFEFKNNESIEIHKHNETTDACKTNFSSDSNNSQNLSNVQKHPSNMIIGFELNDNSTNIFETNESTITKNITSNDKNRELGNTKNTVESTLCSQNSENNVHQIESKNIFELKNDNNDLYQTHNLEKIPEFDFETRIIQNFEMECSNNIQEPVSKKEIFTKSNQTSTEHSDEVNVREYKKQEKLKNSLDILEKPLTEKTSELCNTQPCDINKTNNKKKENELDHIFEVDCMTSNSEKNGSDLKVQNKNAENINSNNSNTRADSNVDVENIFEDLYDNLNILNDEKVKSGPIDSCPQNYAMHDLSKSPEYSKNQNLKINSLEIIGKCYENTQELKSYNASDKTFDDNNHVLLDDFVKLSTSHSETGSAPEKPLVDKTINQKLMSDKYNTNLFDGNLPNNENFLNFSDKNTDCLNDMQLLKTTEVEYSTKKKIVESTNVFNDVLIKQKTHAKKQDNSSVNPVELRIQENLNKMIDTEDSASSSTHTVEFTNQQISNNLENITNSRHSLIDLEELNNQCSHKLETVENINSSKHVDKSACHQPSNEIINGENKTNSSHISKNIDKLICHERSNINIVINDKTNYEHGPLKHLKLKEQQDSHTVSDVKITKSLNTDKSACENSNKIINAEDTNTVSRLLNHNNITKQRNFNTVDKIEIENETNLRPSLLNVDELSRDHDSNEIINIEDTTVFEPNLFSNSELLQGQPSNETVEVENVPSSEPSTFNIYKTTCNQGSNDIIDVENITYSETSSSNVSIKTKYSQDSDEMIDVENNFESNLYNNLELPNHHRSNNILKIEGTSNCKPSTESNLEILNHRAFNKEVNSEDSTHFKLGTLNNIESHNEPYSNEIAKMKDNYSSSTSNFVELTYQKSNKIISVDKTSDLTPILLNKIECFDQPHSQHSMEKVEIENFTNPLPSYIDETTSHQNSDEMFDIEDKTHYKSSSSKNLKTFYQQHFNEIVEVECAINSVSIPLNANDLTCDEKSIKVDNATDFKRRLSSTEKLSKDQRLNKFVKAQDTAIPDSSPLNNDELIHHQTYNKLIDVDDKTQFGFSSTQSFKLTKHDISNKTIEFENADDLELRSFKAVESLGKQNSDTMIIEDTTNCSSINIKQNCQHFKEIDIESASLEKSVSIDNNRSKIENNIGYENAVSKSADDIKLPRVKFFLKCSKSVIKNNIFDEEPLSCKKQNVVKDIKFVAGNIFKKRNHFFKIWQNVPKKMYPDEPKDNNINKVVETIYTQVTSTVVRNLDNLQQKNNDLISLSAELTLSDEKQQNKYDENQKNSKSKVILNDNSLDSCTVDESVDDFGLPPASKDIATPVPSPYSDFQSDSPASEYFGSDEYWDKSLENEYNNVLYRTISKLASKPRTNIRDKFNTRLLARKASKIKRKQQFRRRRQFNETKLRVGDELKTSDLAAVVGGMPPTTVLRLNVLTEKTNPRCKIKVQLPWGRIFNLKSSRPRDQQNREVYNDTKLELGPAKVKVRLSRSPGEWQVATRCQSNQPKSTVVSVRRLVLQRAVSPVAVTSDCHGQSCNVTSRDSSFGVFNNSPQQEERFRKLPKIVIRRNEQDNNYTSYVSTCNGIEFEGGDDCRSDHDEDAPRLIVRLVRDRKLDAMAADGITKLNLRQLVPNPETVADAAEVVEENDDDTHSAKRVRYT